MDSESQRKYEFTNYRKNQILKVRLKSKITDSDRSLVDNESENCFQSLKKYTEKTRNEFLKFPLLCLIAASPYILIDIFVY